MDERRENEQYFFTENSIRKISEFLTQWDSIACLCAPKIGTFLSEQNIDVTILDIDRRFSDLRGFHYFDISSPEWIDRRFDIIICDPPFFNVSLTQLFKAIRSLSHHEFSQNLFISYLERRAASFVSSFSKFNLQPISYFPEYDTLQDIPKNKIQFFSNVDQDQLDPLR